VKEDSSSILSRLLQSFIENQSLLTLQIIAVVSIEEFPKPKELAQSLKQKSNLIQSKQPSFDPKFDIIPIEFVRYYPKFINNPLVEMLGIYEIKLNVKFDVNGWVFIVAIPYSISVNETQLATLTFQAYQVKTALENATINFTDTIPSTNQFRESK